MQQLTSQAAPAVQLDSASTLPSDQVEGLVDEFMAGGRITVPLVHVRQVSQALHEHAGVTPVSYT